MKEPWFKPGVFAGLNYQKYEDEYAEVSLCRRHIYALAKECAEIYSKPQLSMQDNLKCAQAFNEIQNMASRIDSAMQHINWQIMGYDLAEWRAAYEKARELK